MKIYTKKGDKGKTMLFGGLSVPKHHVRVEAYGSVDELNAHLGVLIEYMAEKQMQAFLENIQSNLFIIGSLLATPSDKKKILNFDFDPSEIQKLETEIDQMEKELEPLNNFILPGGSLKSAQAHVVRVVCRRAERRASLLTEEETVESDILTYLNRLSDYFFVLARFLLKNESKKGKIWQWKSRK